MSTVVDFKRILNDVAHLEPSLEVAIGTTGFKGDGDRMFLQVNGTGILLDHEDAAKFLKAADRVARRLEAKP